MSLKFSRTLRRTSEDERTADDVLAVLREAASVPGCPVDKVLKTVLDFEEGNARRAGRFVLARRGSFWREKAKDANTAVVGVDDERAVEVIVSEELVKTKRGLRSLLGKLHVFDGRVAASVL